MAGNRIGGVFMGKKKIYLGLLIFMSIVLFTYTTVFALSKEPPKTQATKQGIKVTGIKITAPKEMDISTTSKVSVKVTTNISTKQQFTVKYVSNNPAVVTIDKAGNIKAVGCGTANITAAVNNITAKASITVRPIIASVNAAVRSNPINGKFLAVYTKTQINAATTTKPANTLVKIQYKSSNPAIATVDSEGFVTGVKPGSVTITAAAGKQKVEIPMIIYDNSTDTDGDGLPDYQELHKYLTNPEKYSTVDDGISDGDWSRRREFTYTMSSTMKLALVQPIEDLNSVYQDARIIATDSSNVSTVEVISYPYGVVAYNTEYLIGNPNWQRDNAADKSLQKYLEPGITTNWDQQMKIDLIKDLKSKGIDPDQLTDVELVRKVIDLNLNASYRTIDAGWVPPFQLVNIMTEKDGKLHFDDKYKSGIDNLLNKVNERYQTNFDFYGLLEHNVYGKQMYYNKVHGNCNSIVTLSATIFRALGIPARIVVIDSPVEIGQNMKTDVKNEAFGYPYKDNNSQKAKIFGGGHTYTELYVGGKWMKADNLQDFPTGEDTHMVANIQPGFKFVEVIFQNILDNTQIGTYEPETRHWPEFTAVSDKVGRYVSNKVKQKLSDYSSKYTKSHVMSANENLFKILSEIMQLQTIGGTGLTPQEIADRNMLAIFQDGKLDIAPQMQAVFKGMDTGDKNFLHVKIVNGKLLIYLKAESAQKLEQFVRQLDVSDFYTEQYINFDK